MRNIKITLAYDGTNYHGFQKQNKTTLPTIQAALEQALTILTKEEVIINGSGRTDAGVHAEGQVANFYTKSTIPAERFPLALNSLLPADIVVWQGEEVPLDFHARFQAKGKFYRYTIYNDRHFSPFWRAYAYHVPSRLDVGLMAAGAQKFVGTHDFRGFCAKDTAVKDYVRTIYSCCVEREGPLLRISVEGSGFLYNMVRIMTGTLLELGLGKRKPEEIAELLRSGERKQAGLTVPPQGLSLIKVYY